MKKEVITRFTYENPSLINEEIQREIDAAGLTNDVTVEDIKNHIHEKIEHYYCQAIAANKDYYKPVKLETRLDYDLRSVNQ